MGSIRKHGLFTKLILHFGIALLVAQIIYLKVEDYLEYLMGMCFTPNAQRVVETNGIAVPFYYDTEASISSQLVYPDRYEQLRHLSSVTPVVLFSIAVVMAALLFYFFNLRKPLKELKKGMEKITQMDLEFEISYHRKDELGKLCESFEFMRANLKKTFQELWKTEEQHANMYASIAHDLRTPLTILKGNNEVLRLLFENKSETAKISETFDISDDAIDRMERYMDAMRQMKALESWDKKPERINLSDICRKMESQYLQLAKEHQINIRVECDEHGECCVDCTLMQLVLDRLVENAIRFAQTTIAIHMQSEKDNTRKCLHIEVTDDGEGFSPKALENATTMFFTTDTSRQHTGIGLAAANSLLKNYKSSLHLKNASDGGAKIWFELPIESE